MAHKKRWRIWLRRDPEGASVHHIGESAFEAMQIASGDFGGAHPSDLDCILDEPESGPGPKPPAPARKASRKRSGRRSGTSGGRNKKA